PANSVMTIEFTLNGHSFLGLNGGPIFKFNEAVSFIISCETQEEVDYYWDKLKEGGDPKALQCGWLKDKFGLSWQVVPAILNEMFVDADQQKVDRVMNAMLQMKKLDILALQKAYRG
ncbi:MAG: VOC family protein, partial [Cytophagaceae bacterium]|nr:VOC family protein [Cytophagaceae bacterium]